MLCALRAIGGGPAHVHLAVAARQVEQHAHPQLPERLQLVSGKLLEGRLIGVGGFSRFPLLRQKKKKHNIFLNNIKGFA